MLFHCETCLTTSISQITTISEWTTHLLSLQHQSHTKTNFRNWSTEQNKISWVVLSSNPVLKLNKSLTLERLVEHFSKFGFLTDLYLDDEANFAIVQIDRPNVSRNNVPLLQPGEHMIEGNDETNVELRRKIDISEKEWSAVLGNIDNFQNGAQELHGNNNIAIAQSKRETKKNKRKERQRLPDANILQRTTSNKNQDSREILKSVSPAKPFGSGVKSENQVFQSLTFYNKNAPLMASSTPKTDNQQKSKSDTGGQSLKMAKFIANKLRSNSSVRNASNTDVHQTDINPVVNSFSSMANSRDFYHLFLDLPNIEPQFRTNNRMAKEFQKMNVDCQLACFMQSITMTHNDWIKRDQVLHELADLLKKRFSKCLLYPFGSMSTGLGDPHSDIDIYVDIFGETTGIHTNPYEGRRQSKQEIMMEIRKLLKGCKYPNNRPVYGKIIPVLSARVPILKFYHIYSKINVDLSFENLLSYQNTKMISFIMTLDERVKPLLLIVRYWGKFHELTGSTLIKNYAFILLVLVFLAHKNIIPTVYHLQSLQDPSYCIEGWNAGFCGNRETVLSSFVKSSTCEINPQTRIPTTRSILQLAQEFFHTCAHIDFSTNMVCSLTSELLPKNNFTPGNEVVLPNTLDRYKVWSSCQSLSHRLNINTPFVLQDPFLLSFNVGGVTTENTLLRFQVACAQMAAILQDSLKSLLDLFVLLPSKVGEKKFMAMQRLHKRHEELRKEVKETLGYEKPKIDNQKEKVPTHLLPLNEIISKKTIRYGQGWETFLHFSLGDGSSKEFIRLFDRELKCLSLNNMIRQVDLENKMKALWLTFATEFLNEVWFPCFRVGYVEEEKVIPLRRFVEDTIGRGIRRGRRKRPVETDTEEVAVENTEMSDEVEIESPKSADPSKSTDDEMEPSIPKSDQERKSLMDKINCIIEQECSVKYYKFQCSASVPFWQKRDHYKKKVIKNASANEDLLSSTAHCPASLLKDAKQDKKSKSSKRKRARHLKRNPVDPLQIELQVIKLIESECVAETPDGARSNADQILFKCNCWFKIDSSYLDDFPDFYMVIEEDSGGFKQNYNAGGSTISTTIKKIFPEYMLFKLTQWFAAEGVSDTESTEAKPRIKDTELVFSFSDEDENRNDDDVCDRDELDIRTPSALLFPDSPEEI